MITSTYIIIIYLLLINIVSFFFMGLDKYKAMKNLWRTPEKTLFLLAILGGSLGSNIGMYIFHHKTKHKSFVIGMPTIFILHIIVVIFYIHKWSVPF
jgi:uncharacterized membrane protein YsdA (DUF1294 family)